MYTRTWQSNNDITTALQSDGCCSLVYFCVQRSKNHTADLQHGEHKTQVCQNTSIKMVPVRKTSFQHRALPS